MAQIGDRVIHEKGDRIGVITDIWAHYNPDKDKYIVRVEVKYLDGTTKNHDLKELINLDE